MQTLRAVTCGLSTKQLPASILDVIDCLNQAGYEAYIVGGGVRDLLLGLNPKDFDAVTDATPAQIKQVFGRRCRIIGRRFELAHVYSGRELIEVATFRAPPKQAQTSAQGMILRDNNWGTIEQDYVRRDFRINAMYYQPRKGVILDFCEGYQDLQQRKLRLLGDPVQRFEEDPVRMLRTLRFAAKLGFEIDANIREILHAERGELLRDVSPHRLYDESQKLFTMGHLTQVLPLLIDYGLWKQLFAEAKPQITPFVLRAAQNTDQRIQVGKTINPAFFYAVMLWDAFLERYEQHSARGLAPSEARVQAGLEVLKRQATRTVIPRFAETFIREVWEMQYRLLQPKPQHIEALATHARFRAGFDFLLLREKAGDTGTMGMGQWWDEYQTLSPDQKEAAIKQYNRGRAKNRRQSQTTTLAATATTPAVADLPSHIEPLLPDSDSRSRTRKPAFNNSNSHSNSNHSSNAHVPKADGRLAPEHPIFKRKRAQRDLTQVVFGPTQ